MADIYPVGEEGAMLPHPDGFVGANYITYIKGAGMRIRIVNVPGSDEEEFREQTAGYVCPCGSPSIYHFTAVDGYSIATYITMDSHEALYFMMNPQKLLENPTEIVDDDGEESIPLIGMLSGSNEPLVPEGEQLDSVIAECIDFLEEQGADTGTFGPDRVKAAEVYGNTEEMFRNFQKLLEGETGEYE